MLPLLLSATVELGTASGDLWLAVFLYCGILIYTWAKNKLGDIRVAVFYTFIMAIIVYSHPEFLWIVMGIYVFTKFGKELFK